MCFNPLRLKKTPVGLEPTTPGLGVRCAIHYATEAYDI